MGARRQDPARDLPPHGRAWLSRHAPRGRIWWHRHGPAGVDGVGGRTRTLDLWRLHFVGAGSYRHVGGPHHPARHARAKAEISSRDHPRRDDLLDRGDRARCGLRCRRAEDAGPPRRRLLGDQRLEDVHHQCGLWRHPDRRRAHRSRRQGQPRHFAVHRRADDAGHLRNKTRQAWLALLRHRRDRLSGCPHPRRKPARRGEPRLLRHHGNLRE